MLKKRVVFVLFAGVLFSLLLSLVLLPSTTRQQVNAEEENVEPLGLYANVSLNINGGGGQVWAIAKNEFTLFPSTVQVYVELYYSSDYQESYTNMTLADRQYIYDLDQGKTLQATASTYGRTLYWQARLRMKLDSADWKDKATDTYLCDGDGNWLKTI